MILWDVKGTRERGEVAGPSREEQPLVTCQVRTRGSRAKQLPALRGLHTLLRILCGRERQPAALCTVLRDEYGYPQLQSYCEPWYPNGNFLTEIAH